jgi:Zn finger protein HypA/HybF involved in hydrogenase expression
MPTSTCKHCSKEFKHGYSSKGIYCSPKCSSDNRKITHLKKHTEMWEKGTLGTYRNPRPLVKKFVTERDGYKCDECGLSEWRGNPITLWLDHIDGDASNNSPDNFRLVCPNCDSQSSTFGAKNYGKGRKSRGMPQYG